MSRLCLFVCLVVHALRRRLQSPASPRPALGSLGVRFLSALPTSAPGLDPSRPRCTGTGLAPCDICTGTGCKVLVPAHPVEPEGCSEATAGAEFSTTVGLFGFTSKPCRGAYPLAISIVRNAIAMGRPCHCHGLAIGLLLVAGIYLPLLWSSPHLCSAVPSCLLFNSYAKPCHASPHAAASGHALRVRRGGHMLAFARPRRHLLRSSHFSLLAVLIPDKETVAHAPNTRRLPLACSEGRQCRPLQVVRCMSSVACRPFACRPFAYRPLHVVRCIVVCCKSSVACRPLHVVRCPSSVECRPLHVPRAGCLSASSCLRRRLPARSAIGWTARVPSASAPRLGSLLPYLHRDWARPCHICTGTRPTPPTTAPGLGSPLPHRRRDWAADYMPRGQPESVLLRERPRSHGFLARMRRVTP
jgi:hypothetical protein